MNTCEQQLHILFLIQGTLLGNRLCICQNKKSTYDHTGDCIRNRCKYTLCKYFVCRFCIDQNVKYRCYNYPSDHMRNHICNYKYSNFAFSRLRFSIASRPPSALIHSSTSLQI